MQHNKYYQTYYLMVSQGFVPLSLVVLWGRCCKVNTIGRFCVVITIIHVSCNN